METLILEEWERVKDCKSIWRHYGGGKEYALWRQRFMKLGLVKPRKAPKVVDRAAYMREYRKKNPDKYRDYTERYWRKRLGVPYDITYSAPQPEDAPQVSHVPELAEDGTNSPTHGLAVPS